MTSIQMYSADDDISEGSMVAVFEAFLQNQGHSSDLVVHASERSIAAERVVCSIEVADANNLLLLTDRFALDELNTIALADSRVRLWGFLSI